MSKSVVRSVKNVTKGYSSIQIKVRNATSNDAWGPTGQEMSEIAQMTYDHSSLEFYEIMDTLDKRLNDKGKNWRHVLKSLKVLDYILHEGSETTVNWARKNIYVIKTLREFQYIDADGKDVGQNVRTSAKELTSLILDEERLRIERGDRSKWKQRVTGLDDGPAPITGYAGGLEPSSQRRPSRKPKTDDEDLEYKLALQASQVQAEEDRKRRESNAPPAADDDLAKAIKLSKEEEDLRRRELEQSNAASLFDDTPEQQPQPTGWNQGYQQQSAVDWFGNPVEQQQPQSTGYLNNLYSQQPQQTGLQNGYNPYQQPQQTGLDQSQFQQPQYLQSQQTAFNMNNPYSQQLSGFEQNQQPQPPQEEALKPGNNNPWVATGQHDGLAPQPTGSNNPFASLTTRPEPRSFSAQRAPTLNTLQEQKTATQFNQFTPSTSFSTQNPRPQQQETDPNKARLNALLASGEGQDTFGNTGDLRIPAQHTAPGHFANSAGSGATRLQPAQTGSNPFLGSQFTGVPQTQYPAQTGPAFGGGGFASANPFGQANQQQQQQQRPQNSGSLIDL